MPRGPDRMPTPYSRLAGRQFDNGPKIFRLSHPRLEIPPFRLCLVLGAPAAQEYSLPPMEEDLCHHLLIRCRARIDAVKRAQSPAPAAIEDVRVVKMCSCTFDLLDTESCYVQCRLQAFDCKGHQLEILNIILGAPVEAHD